MNEGNCEMKYGPKNKKKKRKNQLIVEKRGCYYTHPEAITHLNTTNHNKPRAASAQCALGYSYQYSLSDTALLRSTFYD